MWTIFLDTFPQSPINSMVLLDPTRDFCDIRCGFTKFLGDHEMAVVAVHQFGWAELLPPLVFLFLLSNKTVTNTFRYLVFPGFCDAFDGLCWSAIYCVRSSSNQWQARRHRVRFCSVWCDQRQVFFNPAYSGRKLVFIGICIAVSWMIEFFALALFDSIQLFLLRFHKSVKRYCFCAIHDIAAQFRFFNSIIWSRKFSPLEWNLEENGHYSALIYFLAKHNCMLVAWKNNNFGTLLVYYGCKNKAFKSMKASLLHCTRVDLGCLPSCVSFLWRFCG